MQCQDSEDNPAVQQPPGPRYLLIFWCVIANVRQARSLYRRQFQRCQSGQRTSAFGKLPSALSFRHSIGFRVSRSGEPDISIGIVTNK